MILYYLLIFVLFFIDTASDNVNSKENNSFSEYQHIINSNYGCGLIQENNIVISPIYNIESTNNHEYYYNVQENSSVHNNLFYNPDERINSDLYITNEKANFSDNLMNIDQCLNVKCNPVLESDNKASKAYKDIDNKVLPFCSNYNDLNHTLRSNEIFNNPKGNINISENMFTNQKSNFISKTIPNQETFDESLFQNQPTFLGFPNSESNAISYSDQNTSSYPFNKMKYMYQDLYTDNKEYPEHFYKGKQICLGHDHPNFKINELNNKDVDDKKQILGNTSQGCVFSFLNNDQDNFKSKILLNEQHSYLHRDLPDIGSGSSSVGFNFTNDSVETNDSDILINNSSSKIIEKCKEINEILKDCIVNSEKEFSLVIELTQIIVEIHVINKFTDEEKKNVDLNIKNIINILETTLETCMKSKNICYLFPEFMLYIKNDVFNNCFETKNFSQCNAYQYETIITWQTFLKSISNMPIQFFNIQNTLSLHILRYKLRKFTYFALEIFLDQEFGNLYKNLIKLEIGTKDKSKNNFFNKDLVAFNTKNEIKDFNKRCGIYFRFIFLFQKYEKDYMDTTKGKLFIKKELLKANQKIIILKFPFDLHFFFKALEKFSSFSRFFSHAKVTKKILLPFIKIISLYLLKLKEKNIVFYRQEQKMEKIVKSSIYILKNFDLIYTKKIIEEKNKKKIVNERCLSRSIMKKCVIKMKIDYLIFKSEKLFYNLCKIEFNYFKI